DQPRDCAHEVFLVDPGDILTSVARAAAQSGPSEAEQQVERAALLGAHDDRRSHLHLARIRRPGLLESLFPGRRDVDRETPCVGRARLLPSDDARRFVVSGVETMGVDGCGAGLQPNAGWMAKVLDSAAQYPCRLDPGVLDFAAMGLRVTAIHAPAGQIQKDVGAFELRDPLIERLAVPVRHPPGRGKWTAAQDHNVVSVTMEAPREERSQESRAACENDLHACRLTSFGPPPDASRTIWRTGRRIGSRMVQPRNAHPR